MLVLVYYSVVIGNTIFEPPKIISKFHTTKDISICFNIRFL